MRGLWRASWSDGGGCGGAAGLFFGERPGSNGGSAGRWLLSRSEDGRLPASCCLVGGDGPRRGGGRLFRGGKDGSDRSSCGAVFAISLRRRPGAGGGLVGWRKRTAAGRRASFSGRGGFGHVSRRHRYSLLPPAATARRYRPPSVTRRLSLFPACHYYLPPAAAARRLPPRRLSPSPACHYLIIRCCLHLRRFSPAAPAASLPAACVPAACVPAATVACHPRYSPQSATTRCLPFPPPCAGRADRWAAAAPRVVGRGAMRRRREVLRNNLENRKILPIFVSVKYRGSGLSRPGFLFFIGLSFLWQKRLSI